VTPDPSRADEPLSIAVSGLPSGEQTAVRVTATAGDGRRWTANATRRSDARGRLRLDARLIAGMRSTDGGPHVFQWAAHPVTFTITVGGRTKTFSRALFAHPFHVVVVPAATGITGVLFAERAARHRPAVLVFGGSEGGLHTAFLAAAIAARGYPTLAVAYFGAPGLPPTLERIPLEYFAKALRWLGGRPEVDAGRISVLGISRGSEAALLLGVHYPQLVHGVVALVPSNSSLCGLPACAGPAWTFGGRAVPFTRSFNTPNPTDDPRAVIPVERIRGPVFAGCAGADEVWTSCAYAHAIVARRGDAPTVYFDAVDAAHLVGTAVPYEPSTLSDYLAEPTERGREQLWPKLLAFLRASA
jgi:dienelactone hydrolase